MNKKRQDEKSQGPSVSNCQKSPKFTTVELAVSRLQNYTPLDQ